MIRRTVTGLIAGAYVVLVILLRNWMQGILLYASMLALYLISVTEMRDTLPMKEGRPSGWTLYLVCLLFVPAYLWRGVEGVLLAYCFGVVLVLCAAMFSGNPHKSDMSAAVFPLVYPTLPFLAFFRVSLLPEPYRVLILLSVILSSIASDCFALFFGVVLGKHKLISSVSPNKTWEGAIGGFVMSIVVMTSFGLFLQIFWDKEIWIGHFVFMGAIGSLATQLGDLVASAIKRYCGVKDFGKFFPGHGGVLDRMDGMLFNAVFLFIYSALFIGGFR